MTHRHPVTERDHLNPFLIERQGRTEEDLDKIVELHRELHEVFDEMEAESPENTKRLSQLATIVQQLEFDLQEAWGFEKDANRHSWWFQVPHCACPLLDNLDSLGTELKYWVADCPVHGNSADE